MRAHPEAWQRFAAVAGRRDGRRPLCRVPARRSGHTPTTASRSLDRARAALDDAADRFVAWFARLFRAAAADAGAWQPERLEYRFACSAPGTAAPRRCSSPRSTTTARSTGTASTSTRGAPLRRTRAPSRARAITRTLPPAPLTFDGMPNTRWWAFEDGRTNFGDVTPGHHRPRAAAASSSSGSSTPTTGSSSRSRCRPASRRRGAGLAVTDVFGERTWIEAAGAATTTTGSAGPCSTIDVARRRRAGRHRPCCCCPPCRRCARARRSRRSLLDPRRDGEHGVGGRADDPAAGRGPEAGREAGRETRAFFERARRRLGHPPEPPPLAEGAHDPLPGA